MTQTQTLSPDRVAAARLEAMAHATAMLLATHLSALPTADALRVCEIFSTPFVPLPTDVPSEANAVRLQHREVMVEMLENIADRALQLRRPAD